MDGAGKTWKCVQYGYSHQKYAFFKKKVVDYKNYTQMALNSMQTIKDEKVSKGRALQNLPSQTDLQAITSP